MFWWGFKIGRVWLWNRESLIGKKKWEQNGEKSTGDIGQGNGIVNKQTNAHRAFLNLSRTTEEMTAI